MFKISITVLTFAILFSLNTQAQNRKSITHKTSSTSTVQKNRHKHTHAQVKRKRANRTKAVHYHYRHLPKKGAVLTIINAKVFTIKYKNVKYKYYSGIWYKPW